MNDSFSSVALTTRPHLRRVGEAIHAFGLVFMLVFVLAGMLLACSPQQSSPERYVTVTNGHPDGTGTMYMGREIAQVRATAQGAAWFERPGRSQEELPIRLLEAMQLRPTDVVAEIGAGTGYMVALIAPRLPRGRVLAVEIQQDLLDQIAHRADSLGLENVVPVQGTIETPNLPSGGVDVVLIVGAYTVFSHPFEMLAGIQDGLKPGGRLIIVEYRAEDPTLPVSDPYRISIEQLRREVEAAGLSWYQTRDFLPQQHFVVFRKPIG